MITMDEAGALLALGKEHGWDGISSLSDFLRTVITRDMAAMRSFQRKFVQTDLTLRSIASVLDKHYECTCACHKGGKCECYPTCCGLSGIQFQKIEVVR